MEKLYDLYERYRDYIMAFVLLVLIIGSTAFMYCYTNNNMKSLKEEKRTQKSNENLNIKEKEPEKFYVDVKGEVNTPGVYHLDKEKRVIDAIKLAGGLTEKADTSINNLGKKLKDEMVIIIYSRNEVKKMSTIVEKKAKAIEECKEKATSDNNSCLEEANISEVNHKNKSSNGKTKSNAKETIKTGKVSLNTATKEELMTLTGIGESKANNIIEYRSKNKFTDISEIKNVKGIGDSIFEKIKDNITI